MKTFWTETAKAHLKSIRDYIAIDSPQYAQAMIESFVAPSNAADSR